MSHATVIVSPTVERVQELGIEKAIEWEMLPFDENDECFRDGSRWDWYVVGGRWDGELGGKNIVQIKNLDFDAIRKVHEGWYEEAYNEYSRESKHPFSDVLDGESREAYIARRLSEGNLINAYAFLRNRHWNEGERLGWFGGTAKTECEIANPTDPDQVFGKCLHTDEATGARIVCWNEPSEVWSRNYYHRFIEPLGPQETIALVDYHV